MPEPAVTLKDVARRAGVHPATASRALNPETRLLVSEDTARRVADAAAALGYRPNAVARSLRTRRSHTIGVLIPDLNNPLFPPMVRGLEDRLAADGYVALIGNTDGQAERERQVFEQMRARHVDGFAVATARLHSPLLAEAAAEGLNVVLMNRIADDTSFPSVSVDNERGARLAVGHLVGPGTRRIAYMAGPQGLSTGLSRYRGFLAAMAGRRAGASTRQLVRFAEAFSIEEGQRCGRELLAAEPRLTAIAAGNDMLAVGCYAAIEEAGLSCPGDVSVVGFNDMPFIDRLRPPLTTVAFPHYQLGTEAAAMLLDRMAGPPGRARHGRPAGAGARRPRVGRPPRRGVPELSPGAGWASAARSAGLARSAGGAASRSVLARPGRRRSPAPGRSSPAPPSPAGRSRVPRRCPPARPAARGRGRPRAPPASRTGPPGGCRAGRSRWSSSRTTARTRRPRPGTRATCANTAGSGPNSAAPGPPR